MIGIIDYGMGNLRSVQKAFEYLGHPVRICKTPEDARGSRGIVLPGVGAFDDAALHLREHGFWEFLLETLAAEMPFLGICLGYQLLFESSEESVDGTPGLGVLAGRVRRFPATLKVPHMGWNSISIRGAEELFRGVPDDSFFYFVHSYYVEPADERVVSAITDYQVQFAAAIARKNLYGMQFHPEKSSRWGLAILANFADICGGGD